MSLNKLANSLVEHSTYYKVYTYIYQGMLNDKPGPCYVFTTNSLLEEYSQLLSIQIISSLVVLWSLTMAVCMALGCSQVSEFLIKYAWSLLNRQASHYTG